MTKNVGGIDRILRAAIGLTLIALAATGTVGWWGCLGALPLATSCHGLVPAVCAVWIEYLRYQERRVAVRPTISQAPPARFCLGREEITS